MRPDTQPDTAHDDDRLMRPREVRQRLALSETTFRRLMKRGDGPPVTYVGSTARYRWSDFVAYLDAGSKRSA